MIEVIKNIVKKMIGKREEKPMSLVGKRIVEKQKGIQKLEGLKMLPSSLFFKFIIVMFIWADALFLYQITEKYFAQAAVMSWVAAVVMACILDVTPSVIAGLLNMPKKKYKHNITMIVLGIMMAILFVGIFALRWNSQDIVFDTAGTQLSLTSASTMDKNDDKDVSMGQQSLTLLLGFQPIATSLLSFAIALFDTGREKKEIVKSKERIKLAEAAINVDADNLEIQNELNRDLYEYDNQLKKLELDDITQQKYITKELIKLRFALGEGTPDALSVFMENGGENTV